jgi:PAS domain S-box-containing protein
MKNNSQKKENIMAGCNIYKEFFKKEPEYCYIVSKKGEILDLNDAAFKGLGYKKSDLVGKALKDIYSSESMPKFKKIFSNWKKTGKIKDEELIILTKSGKKRTVLLSANSIKDKKKHIISLVYVQKDITEHKKIDNKLRLLMAAVEEAPDGVLVIDLEGVITYSNKAMEKIYGFSTKDNIGKNISATNIYSDMVDKTIIPAIKKRGRWSGEIEVAHKDGHLFPVLLTASMVKNKKGKPMAMVSIIKDVTKRQKAENALKEKVEELERINKLMIGRELKMIELKREIARLKKSAKNII